MNKLRESLETGKVTPRCRYLMRGMQCPDGQFANGYCFRHQAAFRRRKVAQINFYAGAKDNV